MVDTLRGLTVRTRVLFILCILACGLFFIGPTYQAEAATTASVRADLPIALDGEVWAVEQVGPMVVVGGNFTQVQTSPGGPIVDQASIYAYDMDTGQFIDSFRPVVARTDGTTATVEALVANADGTGVYIGGNFSNVTNTSNGVLNWRQRIALLDVRTGDVDRDFYQGGVSATVVSLDLDQWGRLYAGGNFLSAYEFNKGVPRISHTVRGLARFDAVTGEFDQGFRYEPHAEISLNDQPGVLDTALDPSGTVLFVAHRGGEFRDTVTGTVFDSPGISRIELGANTHAATQYKLLVPDADDPLQEFYNDQTCNRRGVMIREIDVADDFIAVVHWGGDNGINCDTTARFPNASGVHRPDWVSRAFDSLFSVEIDGDVIYIGGHFRYLVNDTAPSPYPGASRPNGGAGINIYGANPNHTAFRVDLIEPGYVYESFQLGALDAATGFGDPTFNPVSNAHLGVLEITAIDRGLLIGQDNNRVNFIETGRSAFFDNDPAAGKPQCSVTLDDGVPVLSWTDVGGVSEWQIAANGEIHGTAAGDATTYSDTAAAFGETSEFELYYERNDVPLTAACGSILRPTPSLSCAARLDNGDAVVTWNDRPWDSVEVSANGSVVATVDGQPATYSEVAAVGSTTFALRAFAGDDIFEAACSGEVVVVPGDAMACVATLANEQVTLSWSAPDATTQSVRRNGKWVTRVADDATSYSETPGFGDFEYLIRVRIDGQNTDVNCDPSPITITEDVPVTLECTATLVGSEVHIAWTGSDATTQSVRRNGKWEATVPNGLTTYTSTPGAGAHAYVLRLRIDGVNTDLACGTEPIIIGEEPVVVTCVGAYVEGGILLTWNDTGADTQVIRRNDRWVATLAPDATSFTFAQRTGDYVLRLFTDGVRSDVACELQTVNVALGQPATQSSDHPANGLAERAVDGNTNGIFRNGSVSLTNEEAQPWWQVDTGQVGSISSIEIYNRTQNCCRDDLSDVVVFISDTDMTGRSLADLEADQAVTSISVDGQLANVTTLNVNTEGRFVRVQLRGTNFLSLAEVIVYN